MEDKRLEHLMGYTQFHIGAYMTLCSALAAVLALKTFSLTIPRYPAFLKVTLVCFAGAAVFGGLVGSSIPHYRNFEEFKNARLGPWKLPLLPSLVCTHLEHTFFWVGVSVAIVGLYVA